MIKQIKHIILHLPVVLFILMGLSFLSESLAQNNIHLQSYRKREASINSRFKELRLLKDDSAAIELNKLILAEFDSLFAIPGSFEMNPDTALQFSFLQSSDHQVRIANWNIAFQDGTFEYFGFIQYFNRKKKKVETVRLNDKSSQLEKIDKLTLSPERWYGALYYSIITKKHKRKSHYVLLGWDGNDQLTSKKLIESLVITDAGKIVFGEPVFSNKSKFQNRIVFEYSKQVVMALRYSEKLDMIVFDHLSPSESYFKGQYQFYGPDFSYDAYKYKKGKWELVEDVDARNLN